MKAQPSIICETACSHEGSTRRLKKFIDFSGKNKTGYIITKLSLPKTCLVKYVLKFIDNSKKLIELFIYYKLVFYKREYKKQNKIK